MSEIVQDPETPECMSDDEWLLEEARTAVQYALVVDRQLVMRMAVRLRELVELTRLQDRR